MAIGDVRHFEWFAPVYDLVMPAADAPTFERAFERAAVPIDRVLDVGGGTGRAARALSSPERIVIDPAGGMLSRARRHDLAAVRGDGSRLPVRDESVDAVTIVDALHHIADRRGALAEAYRALRPGGVVVIFDFDPSTLRGRLLTLAERLVLFDSTFAPPDALYEMLESPGFEAETIDRGFTFTLVGRKPP
jgi:ubiquinone/menaquinone biosynthesis C-methylase UbiE